MHTGRWKPFIATQDENHKQKECVFAWRVLLRNVTLVHKSQKGIMDEPQYRKRGQLCVPALTWNRSNSNISAKKPWSMSDRRWLYSHPWSEIANWGAEWAFFIFKRLYTITTWKSTDAASIKGPETLKWFFRWDTTQPWDSEENPGAGARPLQRAQRAQPGPTDLK